MARPARSALFVAAALACALALEAQSPQTSRLLDRTALLRDLQALSADRMEGRQVGTRGGARARAYVVERFKAAGLQPFGASFEAPFQFSTSQGAGRSIRGVNVIGRIEGVEQPARHLVVSAHYDHVGVRNGQVYNGADDNASGTAALFALAAYFRGHRPRHSIVFAAFDAEEVGLRGSRAFVASPPVERASIAANVNIDMVARDRAGRLYAAGTFLNPFLKPYVERVATRSPVTLLLGHDDPRQKGVEDWTRDSDHWSFQEAGIPALYVGVEDYEHHHKPTDDYENVTHDFFVGAVETCLELVRELDAHLDEIAMRK